MNIPDHRCRFSNVKFSEIRLRTELSGDENFFVRSKFRQIDTIGWITEPLVMVDSSLLQNQKARRLLAFFTVDT